MLTVAVGTGDSTDSVLPGGDCVGPLKRGSSDEGPSQRAHFRPKSEQRKEDSNVKFSLVGVGVGLNYKTKAEMLKTHIIRTFKNIQKSSN